MLKNCKKEFYWVVNLLNVYKKESFDKYKMPKRTNKSVFFFVDLALLIEK